MLQLTPNLIAKVPRTQGSIQAWLIDGDIKFAGEHFASLQETSI
jgi:hypothetical protein